jgi:hypothetical protein
VRALVLTAALGLLALLTAPVSALAAAGDLDPSFSGDGIATTPEGSPGVALDSRGRIVVAFYYGAERFMPNGTLDRSFSGDGMAPLPFQSSIASAESVAVDSTIESSSRALPRIRPIPITAMSSPSAG